MKGYSLSRRRALAGAAGASLLGVTAAAWIAAGQARTPSQRAQTAQAPPPSVLTAEVTGERIVDRLVLQGRLARSVSVTVSGSASIAPGVTKQIVTRLPVRAGDRVWNGTVLAELSGRPLIALDGEFSAFRDLTSGDRGSDVVQLQRALRGPFGTPITAVFDARTEADVRRLYAMIDYPPPSTTTVTPGAAAPPFTLPAREIAYIPRLPVAVGELKTAINGDATGPLMTLVGGGWQIIVPLSQATDRALAELPAGVKMTAVDGPAAGRTAKLVRIRQVPAAAGSGTSPNGGRPAPAREAVFSLPGNVTAKVGADQIVIIERRASPPGALVVPLSALWTEGGQVVVTVVDGASRRRVPVVVRLTVEGRVAVTAAGPLRPGDQVLIGSGPPPTPGG